MKEYPVKLYGVEHYEHDEHGFEEFIEAFDSVEQAVDYAIENQQPNHTGYAIYYYFPSDDFEQKLLEEKYNKEEE